MAICCLSARIRLLMRSFYKTSLACCQSAPDILLLPLSSSASALPFLASLAQFSPGGAPLLDLLGYDWQGPRVATHTSPARLSPTGVCAPFATSFADRLQVIPRRESISTLAEIAGLSFCPTPPGSKGSNHVRSPQFCFCCRATLRAVDDLSRSAPIAEQDQ